MQSRSKFFIPLALLFALLANLASYTSAQAEAAESIITPDAVQQAESIITPEAFPPSTEEHDFIHYGNMRLSTSNLAGVSSFSRDIFLVTALDGIKFFVKKDDHVIGPLLIYSGQWEWPFQRAVFQLMDKLYADEEAESRSRPAPLWLDVGANVGIWSVQMANHIKLRGGRVIAFEPQQEMMSLFSTSLLLNEIHNVQIVNAFVSNSTGHTEISRVVAEEEGWSVNYGAASKAQLESSNKTSASYRVPNIRLDDAFLDAGGLLSGVCPDFLKMDIETGEVAALIGATELLRTCQPVLFLETECVYLYRSIFSLLDSLGYALAFVLLPVVDPFLKHFERSVENTFDNLINLYISRNVMAVPKARAALLDQVYLARIDVQAERAANSSTWHSFDERTLVICHRDSNQCFRWLSAQDSSYMPSRPERGEYTCGTMLLEERDVLFYRSITDAYTDSSSTPPAVDVDSDTAVAVQEA